jgi:hypothetical protein
MHCRAKPRKRSFFWQSAPQVASAANHRAATPENSTRNSECDIAVKSEVFDLVASGSPATSTSTDELRGARAAKHQGVAPQPRAANALSEEGARLNCLKNAEDADFRGMESPSTFSPKGLFLMKSG